MARYIDAELIKYERHEKRGLGIDYGIDEESYHEVAYKKNIDKIPTADVQEVIHGHWVESARIYGKFFCSECYSAVMGKGKDMLYCPNCGAKMDEEVNEDV